MKVKHSFKEAYDFFPHFTSSQNLPLYTQQCWRIPGQQHCKFKQHLKMQEEAIGLTTLLGHSMRTIFPHQTQKYFMLDQNTLTQKYSWLWKQTNSQQRSHILPILSLTASVYPDKRNPFFWQSRENQLQTSILLYFQ